MRNEAGGVWQIRTLFQTKGVLFLLRGISYDKTMRRHTKKL